MSQVWWYWSCAELKNGSQAVSSSAMTGFRTPETNLTMNFVFSNYVSVLVCHAGSRWYFVVIYILNFHMLETAWKRFVDFGVKLR